MRQFNFTFTDANKQSATHFVQRYDLSNWTTLLLHDRSEEFHCGSVTKTIEELVSALVKNEGLKPDSIVAIECYDDLGTFDLVRFHEYSDGKFSDPFWRPITKAEALGWCGKQEVSDAVGAGQQS